MEEKLILEESTHMEEKINEELPKVQPRKKNKNDYKEKECEVISYNSRNNTLDVRFDRYGIRIKNVKFFDGTPLLAHTELSFLGRVYTSPFLYMWSIQHPFLHKVVNQ